MQIVAQSSNEIEASATNAENDVLQECEDHNLIEAKMDPLDPFVSTEPGLELDAETNSIFDERIASCDAGQVVSAEEAWRHIQEWLAKSAITKTL